MTGQRTIDLPRSVYRPPLNTTRASHVVLTVHDLAASREFRTEVIGPAVSDQDRETVYPRDREESCRHGLVLKAAPDAPAARSIGMRVLSEDDLDGLKRFFDDRGLAAEFADEPFQGRTIRTRDRVGTPVDYCASMQTRPRLLLEFGDHRGGNALRIDHFQIHTPEVMPACRFHVSFGFRRSGYIVAPDGAMAGVFVQRKGNPHDIVFFHGPGPRLHHLAYTCREATL
jgi:catechol 2,3-dioxygenase